MKNLRLNFLASLLIACSIMYVSCEKEQEEQEEEVVCVTCVDSTNTSGRGGCLIKLFTVCY